MAETFWPAVAPVVTEEAGTRGGEHAGIDLAAKRGDPVLAPFDGTVVYVGGDGASGRLWVGYWLYPNGEGRTVDIRRADGLISRVGHLEGYNVRAGQTVKAGDCVGFAGDSGYSTGVHIHWETRWDRTWVGGRWINPRLLNPQVFRKPEPTPEVEEEDEEMARNVCVATKHENTHRVRIFDLVSGEEHQFSSSDTKYIGNVATTYGCALVSYITNSHYAQIGKELTATRARLEARA